MVLAWGEVSSGLSPAPTFRVKRSTTSGGPYTQVGAPTATTYTDTGLTNGTTYYYVVSAVNSAGESGNSSEVTATPVAPPAAPTGVSATPGNAQVVVAWTASTGATGYHVKRGTTSGGPYTQVGAPTASPYTDTGLTNGTPYYYVVTAFNAGGESANSTQVTATPLATASVTVSIDTLSNRHPISPYVYGGAYPQDAAHIADSGMTVVRWGGDATSRYNWQTQTYNAGNDYYYSDYLIGEIGDSSSTRFITDVINAGSSPLMTFVMLDWVSSATQANDGGQVHSFSVAKYGAQCATDPYDSDAGDGILPGANCLSSTNYVAGNNPNDANVPLVDDSTSTCPSNATSPCTLYRSDWAAALATAFGSAPHFYNMDNEPEIWGSTHRDVHPNPSGYEELRDTYIHVASELKTWDPAAIRLGPITCCWWFYWNGANSADKPNHASQDYLPWWVNEVYWRDQISGVPSVEVFDVHAYPDSPDTSTYTQAQKQALAVRIYRDYWDPTYTSESGGINQIWTTQIQPNHAIPFRIPRLRAIYNSTYPEINKMSITEWSAPFAGESDFSTAIGDADAYGILGRERVYLASRWGAPVPANPNYQALKLYANYDGAHHMFGTTSVSATHNADPNLFSVYAALGKGGSPLTIMVLNKDPGNSAVVNFQINNFSGTSCTAYTLSQSSPNAIVNSSCQASGSMTFAPYTVSLLVFTGAQGSVPAAEWDLNPDTTMVPAGGTVTLHPVITSGISGPTIKLAAASFDSGGGTMSITSPNVTQAESAAITVTAGTTPGFYHYTVVGIDSSNVIQQQGGWIIVGNPPATFTKTGDLQTSGVSTTLTLSVTFNPGSSEGTTPNSPTAGGATIRFTTDSGTLSGGTTGNATTQLVTTNSSGVATVTLTLPATAGPVNVTAEGPYQLGHPIAKFSETAN